MKNTFMIAEVGQAHDGSLGILHSYIDALAKTGVDAVKFQTHIAEAESSEYDDFRINFSYEDRTRFDYWKRMEFTFDQWAEIKNHCLDVGLEFISSPFSNMAVDLLKKLDLDKYKIGSGEVTNLLMLEKIAKTGKDILLSSGLSNITELDQAIEFLKQFNCKISIMQCTTKYPTQPEEVGLNVISELKDRYNIPVGLSDHSGTIYPSLAAVSLGVDLLEFHVTFDKNMFGPDSSSSLTIGEIKQLVEGVRFIDKSIGNQVNKQNNVEFKHLKNIFEKSLVVNRKMKKGDKITFDDLDAIKPSGYGISPSEFKNIIGRVLNKEIKKWGFINYKDIF